MKKIEGLISDQVDEKSSEKYIVFHTYGSLSRKYSHYNEFDEKTYKNPHLYVPSLPPFEEVYKSFVSLSRFPFIHGKAKDVCLSLFYNPYFDEFYGKMKREVHNLSWYQKVFLKNHMLKYLANRVQYEMIVKLKANVFPSRREHYVKKDIYEKSNELLKIIGTN